MLCRSADDPASACERHLCVQHVVGLLSVQLHIGELPSRISCMLALSAALCPILVKYMVVVKILCHSSPEAVHPMAALHSCW